MSFLQTRAIVLLVTDYGESDKIVTLYTSSFGKLKAIAKGAKRSKQRFVNKLEFFSLLEATVVPGRLSSLFRLDHASLLAPFPALREDYHRYTAAMLVCELVNQWTRENDVDERLFALLCWGLQELAEADSVSSTVIFFQIKMLDLLGVGLQLDRCPVCGGENQAALTSHFSPGQSGILCPGCTPSHGLGLIPVSMATLKTMRAAQSMPLERLRRLKISRQSLAEMTAILKLYSNYQLQREIQSWKQFPLACS